MKNQKRNVYLFSVGASINIKNGFWKHNLVVTWPRVLILRLDPDQGCSGDVLERVQAWLPKLPNKTVGVFTRFQNHQTFGATYEKNKDM